MKIVVIGGTGLIGSRLVNMLNQLKYDHEIQQPLFRCGTLRRAVSRATPYKIH